MIYIGIDNGVTGSIGVINKDNVRFFKTPVKKELNYTKKKSNITRIDVVKLHALLNVENAFVLIERPLVNPRMFKATISAVRALEATLNVIEMLKIPYQYIDSKEWQKNLLPSGIKGSPELKKASMDIGCRLFPKFSEEIKEHEDADGLLIAEYCKIIKK